MGRTSIRKIIRYAWKEFSGKKRETKHAKTTRVLANPGRNTNLLKRLIESGNGPVWEPGEYDFFYGRQSLTIQSRVIIIQRISAKAMRQNPHADPGKHPEWIRYDITKPPTKSYGEGGQGSVWPVIGVVRYNGKTMKYKDLRQQRGKMRLVKVSTVDSPFLKYANDKTERLREVVEKESTHAASVDACFPQRGMHIQHPVFTLNGTASCITMRLTGAMDFTDLIDNERKMARLSLDQRLYLAMELILCVMACHLSGVIHRDVKPANIRISKDWKRAWLVDYGLSCPINDPDGSRPGTLPFAAPELLNSGSGTPDERVDFYSLGRTLAFLFNLGEQDMNSYFPPENETKDIQKKWVLDYKLETLFTGLRDINSTEKDTIREVLTGLLKVNPDERMSGGNAFKKLAGLYLKRCPYKLLPCLRPREQFDAATENTTEQVVLPESSDSSVGCQFVSCDDASNVATSSSGTTSRFFSASAQSAEAGTHTTPAPS